jgi:hypothetical protein
MRAKINKDLIYKGKLRKKGEYVEITQKDLEAYNLYGAMIESEHKEETPIELLDFETPEGDLDALENKEKKKVNKLKK